MTLLGYARAFSVHALTASGAGLALLALLAAVRGAFDFMFLCLGLALIVDGIDGTFARAIKVAEVLPRWSGDILDLVVDFVTYVFVPAYAIAAGGLLPAWLGAAAGIVIVMTGAIYFADRRMKTADNYFRGFPTLWNVVAFYLFVLKPAPWLAALLVAVLAVLTFVPFKFLHPFRVVRLRMVSTAAVVLWSLLAADALARGLAPGPMVTGGLVVLAVYFLCVGLTEKR
ncbi:MAG TPA: CDP-alcohol phosphatidyltransferase family protein [Xanthobacteraceae bacterium]|nr:CDP-alcohol phosphatidyltransferase family protein [Xanthobacteraceae bacterium]